MIRARVGDRIKFSMTNRSDEVAPGLQVIAPPVERHFELPDIARFEDLHLERASVMFRKQRLQDRDVYDYLVVSYRLDGPVPAPNKGADPADLPVEFPMKYPTVFNRKTADAIGLDVPDSFLSLVDDVIG